MHVLAFFGLLALLLVQIVAPRGEPAPPPVNNAAELTAEQRARSAAPAATAKEPGAQAEEEADRLDAGGGSR